MLPGPMTTQAVINPGPMRWYQERFEVGESDLESVGEEVRMTA